MAKSDLCSLSSEAWHKSKKVYFDKVTKDELSLDAAKKWARYEIKTFLYNSSNKNKIMKSLQIENYLSELDIIILHNKMSNLEDTKELLIKAENNSSIVEGFNALSIATLEYLIEMIKCNLLISSSKLDAIKLEAFKRVLCNITMTVGLHIRNEKVNKI